MRRVERSAKGPSLPAAARAVPGALGARRCPPQGHGRDGPASAGPRPQGAALPALRGSRPPLPPRLPPNSPAEAPRVGNGRHGQGGPILVPATDTPGPAAQRNLEPSATLSWMQLSVSFPTWISVLSRWLAGA